MRAIFAVLLLGFFSHHAYGDNGDTNTTTATTPPSLPFVSATSNESTNVSTTLSSGENVTLTSNGTESTSVLSPHTTSETVTNASTTQSSTEGVSTPSPSTNAVITVPSTSTQAPTQTSKAPSTVSPATLNPVLSTTEATGTTQTTGSSDTTETTLKATFITPTISATVQPTGSTPQPTTSSDPNKSTATVPPIDGTDPNPQTPLPTDTATTTSQLTPQSTVNQAYLEQLIKKHEPKPKDQETHQKNTTLIAILCSCGAVLAVTFGVITYIYITRHRQSYKKNQVSCHSYRLFDTWHRKSHSKQHLTEEMQTVENGYHDNPTLEVMEVQPEMQEKKAAMNGEFNDSWIVPFDNLAKDDVPDEEDTHL
ncbi:hypothetical protein JZ751_015962 [Albula glossodonta]|uniref:Podocalyxin n=1 Tax=Albula glossodonta TaxID=121402 RepID=A0A8T2NQA5_9TELE|nr:hypothetical protein JZ751_015962 [Albula glossodonta]